MLDQSTVGLIKGLLLSGKSITETAELANVSRASIYKYKQRGFKHEPYDTSARQKNPERKKRVKILEKLADQVVRKQHRVWPKHSSSSQLASALMKEEKIKCSASTARRDLRKKGRRAYVRRKDPTRTTADVKKRRAFARKHRNIDWKRVVFSDESWFCCNERTGRMQWCKNRRDVLPLEKKARWNVPSIMIWASVGYNFKGPLVIFPAKKSEDGELRQFRLDGASYVRRCLSTTVPQIVSEERIFMQDGARSHVAKSTMVYLERKNVEVLSDWPAYSPDLNAIERIWKEMNQRVGAHCPMTMKELEDAVVLEWERLPMNIINAHCAHFPRQLRRL